MVIGEDKGFILKKFLSFMKSLSLQTLTNQWFKYTHSHNPEEGAWSAKKYMKWCSAPLILKRSANDIRR